MPTYGIDANPAVRPERTGTEQYTLRLLEAMKHIPLTEGEQVVLYSADDLLEPLADLPEGWSAQTLKWMFKRAWTQVRLSWEMWRRPPSVLFVPAHAVPKVHPPKTVTTIHDVGFRRYPQLYASSARRYLEATTRFAVKHCTAILTPSEFTKRELVTLYGAKPEKVFVTPLAPGTSTTPSTMNSDALHENLLPAENPVALPSVVGAHYFLTVSRIEAKKNIATLIRGFEIFKERRGVGDPFQLILVGKPGFGFAQIKMLIDRSPFRPSIHLLGFVDDQTLQALMSSATAYVYPSWYEGLGISALEALTAGTPLVASDIPALREVAMDVAWYFPPASAEELSMCLRQVADGDGVEEKHALGLSRATEFDWQKTAAKTFDVLRDVL